LENVKTLNVGTLNVLMTAKPNDLMTADDG